MPETLSSETPRRQPLNRQRGGYNREIEWYLTELSRIMGERSNFGGLVASIERGGSGGNSGTKGVGMVRIEPFENWGSCTELHRAFARAVACEATWRRMGLRHQWVLAARYCMTREKLPPGLHGQLGDLSAVAFVVAYRVGPEQVQRLMVGAAQKKALRWAEDSAAKELEIAHAVWQEERVGVDRRSALRIGRRCLCIGGGSDE